MGTVTKTVGTSSRQYSTLSAAIASIPSNLVTDGNNYVIQLYNDSEFTGTPPLGNVSGFTTDASHTITINCGSGQSFYDNANKTTNKLQYNQSYGVGLRATSTGSGSAVIAVSTDYVTVQGLQISDGGQTQAAISQTGTATHSVFENLVCESSFTSSGSGAISLTGATAVNCLALNNAGGTGCISQGSNSIFVAITSVQVGSANNYGFRGNYDSPLYLDCVSMGFGTAFKSGTSGSSDYNCSGDTTAPGSHSLKSKTYANQFVNNSNSSSRDFRVKSGADLINAGTPESSYTGGLDIINQTRSSSTPTIGAWEYISGGGVTVNLSGQGFTFTQANVSEGTALTLSGSTPTFTQGTVAPNFGMNLTGTASNFTQASVAMGLVINPSAQNLSFTQGSVMPSWTVGLSGINIAMTPANIVPNLGLMLNDQAMNFTAANLGPFAASAFLNSQPLNFTTGFLNGGAPTLPEEYITFARRKTRM
ncbi:MAG: hypothetical protein JO269_09640 [Burkholderiaceae bacterium]|nr:hypothetical protein [Burkholderiaceae bacterium]